ncbi:hypothetical protein OS493_017114 [Desmophyllum pertusum]|uniref:G-protein coupled receptors family 1 profile domain-containing protein n=1 Tax=Desmophyllum pertusum TaxID=174260 RepID=A0A9W9YDX5_9CNID|nr:hypothetical protein OS493_017114 [Desmophyllum pertusum]
MLAVEACHGLPTAQWNIVLTTILGLLISFIACTTNVLILVAIYKKPALRTVTNYSLASLAVGDFFVGIVALPLWIARSLLAVANEEHLLSISVDCVYVLSVGISTYNLCTVSLERFVGVTLPLRYHAIVTTRRFQYAVASVWVLSSCIASLRLVISEDSYWIVAVSTVYFIPGFVISYCYICIFKEASRQSRVIGQQNGSALATQMHNKKASITIAIVIGVFYLTALPALAFSITEVVSGDSVSCQENKSFESWGTWALFLAYSNAAINPWIYAARKSEFRDAFKVLMFWKQH